MTAAACLALAAGPAAAPAHAAPLLDQLVVFKSGKAKQKTARASGTRLRAGRRRCRVPAATPLAALARARLRPVVHDFSGSCDPGSLFVRAMGGDRNRGQDGWVYKVGNRQATTAASDPSGPFGSGRIRRRTRVTWFYCRFGAGGCQRTLVLRVLSRGAGAVRVRVRAHDDEGRGAPAAGAVVRGGGQSATTDSDGRATLALAAGRHRLAATKRGAIRSFWERVRVR